MMKNNKGGSVSEYIINIRLMATLREDFTFEKILKVFFVYFLT